MEQREIAHGRENINIEHVQIPAQPNSTSVNEQQRENVLCGGIIV